MKVSIIIRAFNEEKFIGKLYSEIFKQKVDFDYEVILVDSGSTDRTLDITSEYNVEVIRINPADFTFGYSLNQGIKASSGEICVMISAHCYPCSSLWLQNIITPFVNQNVAIVYGRQLGTDETAYSEHRIFNRWFPNYNIEESELAFCNNANSAIRKSLWNVYKFDEKLTGLEDLDWAKHVKKLGSSIYYQADASIYHIHEQNMKQVYTRYYREAFAYKEIYKHEYFSLIDFFKFFIMNWGGDYIHALKDGVFLRNIISIPVFRCLQFWGTYKAHQYKVSINNAMKRKLYYPDKPDFKTTHKASVTAEKKSKETFIDITRTVDENTAVWPGVEKFSRKSINTIDDTGVNDSTFSMNVHTGTHMDAPSHFLKNGVTIDHIPVTRFFGSALVVDYNDNKPIDHDFVKKIIIPKGVRKLLFKTINSDQSSEVFSKSFIALTSKAAKWIANNNIELVGIDGPSIQLFHDENNDTHKYLLEEDIIIVENLNLKNVKPGKYNLTVLPIKIGGLEGAPARAVLSSID